MKIPVRKLLKREVEWLAEHNCRHGHSYLEHYSCFLAEKPDTSPMVESIGIFDIETTGLKANWSHMLSWCVKEHGKNIVHSDLLTRKEVRDKDDLRIIKSCIDEIKKYDRIVGFYSTRFDIPYVRSRAMMHKVPFPAYRDLYHTDMYYIVRSKLAIHSNRLGSVCQFLGIEAKNHPMTPELWVKAGRGDAQALNEILIHNVEDVYSTDAIFKDFLEHMLINKRSI